MKQSPLCSSSSGNRHLTVLGGSCLQVSNYFDSSNYFFNVDEISGWSNWWISKHWYMYYSSVSTLLTNVYKLETKSITNEKTVFAIELIFVYPRGILIKTFWPSVLFQHVIHYYIITFFIINFRFFFLLLFFFQHTFFILREKK